MSLVINSNEAGADYVIANNNFVDVFPEISKNIYLMPKSIEIAWIWLTPSSLPIIETVNWTPINWYFNVGVEPYNVIWINWQNVNDIIVCAYATASNTSWTTYKSSTVRFATQFSLNEWDIIWKTVMMKAIKFWTRSWTTQYPTTWYVSVLLRILHTDWTLTNICDLQRPERTWNWNRSDFTFSELENLLKFTWNWIVAQSGDRIVADISLYQKNTQTMNSDWYSVRIDFWYLFSVWVQGFWWIQVSIN